MRLNGLLPDLVEGRYFITDELFESLRQSPQYPRPYDKPNGLWYSCGDEWFQFILGEGKSLGVKRYIYEIQLNTEFVLTIPTAAGIRRFTEDYSPADYKTDPLALLTQRSWIEWGKVAKRYSGVEIVPYQWSERLSMTNSWYYGWDVASGCVWDERAVKKISLLADLDSY